MASNRSPGQLLGRWLQHPKRSSLRKRLMLLRSIRRHIATVQDDQERLSRGETELFVLRRSNGFLIAIPFVFAAYFAVRVLFADIPHGIYVWIALSAAFITLSDLLLRRQLRVGADTLELKSGTGHRLATCPIAELVVERGWRKVFGNATLNALSIAPSAASPFVIICPGVKADEESGRQLDGKVWVGLYKNEFHRLSKLLHASSPPESSNDNL